MRKSTRLRAGAAAAVLLVAGSLTGCSASGADGETKTIRYQTNAGLVDLPELADALGYFEGTGIKLDRVGDVQGGPESLRAVATDQVDYGGAFNGAIAKLASTGAPITAVISYYGSDDEVNSSLLVEKGSGIDSAEDLIGKKIAVNTLGANAEAVIDTYLEKEGLSQDEIDEVTLVPLPSINAEAALREGQVDGAYLFGSLKEVALENGGLEEVVSDTELVGPYNGGSYVLSDRFIKENPTTTKSLRRRHREGARLLPDALGRRGARGDEEVPRGARARRLRRRSRPVEGHRGAEPRRRDQRRRLHTCGSTGSRPRERSTPARSSPSEIYTNEYNPYAEEK